MPPDTHAPLTPDEAREALRKGQGRIVQHLREHGGEGLLEVLLDACLHCQVYDVQCEGGRSEWLMSLIDLAGDSEHFRARIVEALGTVTDDRDAAQLLGLALEFARRGCAPSRTAIYAIFDEQRFSDDWLGGEQIVVLDGMAGFLHVAEAIATRIRDDSEQWVYDNLRYQADEQCGEEAVTAALEERARNSPALRAYLDRLAPPVRENDHAGTPGPRRIVSLAEMLALIDTAAPQYRAACNAFGRYADGRDVEVIYERLLREERREQLLRCLWVFRRRALPRMHERLFALTEDSDEDLQFAALAALGASRDAAIRELGLRLLPGDPRMLWRGVLLLFKHNYVLGDHEVIEPALRVSDDPGITHEIGYDLLSVAESQLDPELAGCLEWVWEHTPCTNCRLRALKCLLDRGRVTVSLLEEAAWDSDEDTRRLARAALGVRPSTTSGRD